MCAQIHHMGFFRQIHNVCARIENGPKVETAHPHPYRLYRQSCFGLQRYDRISILCVVYILNVDRYIYR
jgi:hypothetical protein